MQTIPPEREDIDSPFALRYSTNNGSTFTKYYYVLNLQGDVVKLINASGTVYASYTYNAYGEILTATGSMADINPLRYRGYYYDTETGFYYLQSRYYDPVIGRFINADGYASTGQSFTGYNMFAYCNNNPVKFKDTSGATIELASSSTEEQIEQYWDAILYLSNSPTFVDLLTELTNAEETITIVFNNEHADAYVASVLFWDPTSGLVLMDGSIQSAALGLAHEMGHAAQDINGELVGIFVHPEQKNVFYLENPIARELGEPERKNYFDTAENQFLVRMPSPTRYKNSKGTRGHSKATIEIM